MRKIPATIIILAFLLAACATAPGSLRASISDDTIQPAPTAAALLAIQATAVPLPTFTPTVAPLVLAIRQGETWNMRQDATEASDSLTILAGGEKCEILARDASQWLWVACRGLVGYVHRDAFAPGEVTP